MKCIIANGLVGTGIQDIVAYQQNMPPLISTAINTQPYQIGNYDGYAVCIDPYMAYADNGVYVADNLTAGAAGQRTHIFDALLRDCELDLKEFPKQWETYCNGLLRRDKVGSILKEGL